MSTNDELDKSFQTPPREDLIQTAIKFLQNPKVVNTPLAQKQKFLQRKGLTDEEVQMACERSGAYEMHENQSRVPPPLPAQLPIPYNTYTRMEVSIFHRIRNAVHNAAIFSIVGYALYKFYEKFIKPYLFGRKKSVEETVEELNKTVTASVGELKDGLASVKVEVDRIGQGTETSTQRQLQNLQSEISTVKGLLLSRNCFNRKNFPSVSNSPVVPPSIPAWQMSSVQEPDTDGKGEELLEIGSGSGSSDPEHATKTSDSSLEIM
ncbi:PREDICTED: peroxisomal membrane protein PEX14 isoform X2 [Nicrophorus vespilloides]|uniref:Peroxisomal membrane protein PEX14 n=1 Tax=Nicrophorus vespilloides TaxID=110193 RepID=A0ABM1MZK9_NICVS|nr:PREDICTED: peroxisomal membrane protein PEX14 isoform X2 [Nicrophorus vespilloides]